MAALERCIGPLSVDEFFNRFFERTPLATARPECEGAFEDILTIQRFEEIIHSGVVKIPFFRVLSNGHPLPLEDYTTEISTAAGPQEGVPSFEEIYELYKTGSSIVLQALQLYDPVIAKFCYSLHEHIGGSIQANAYLSPPGEHALPPHYDTHDVFILQLFGAKNWRIWDNFRELPLKSAKERFRGMPNHGWPSVEDKQPLIDLTLVDGQTLYIPRGFMHVAISGKEPSLHLTIGAKYTLVSDVLTRAVRSVLTSIRPDQDLCSPLPTTEVGWLNDCSESSRTRFEKIKAKILRQLDLDAALREAEAVTTAQRMVLGGSRLKTIMRQDRLTCDSIMILQDGPCLVSVDNEQIQLSYWRGTANFHSSTLAALNFVLSTKTFTPKEIPLRGTIDDRVQFAEMLVNSGLCAVIREGVDVGRLPGRKVQS